MTADRLDFLDNILRTSPFRAFERHVFQQMRDTIDFRRFVPAPLPTHTPQETVSTRDIDSVTTRMPFSSTETCTLMRHLEG